MIDPDMEKSDGQTQHHKNQLLIYWICCCSDQKHLNGSWKTWDTLEFLWRLVQCWYDQTWYDVSLQGRLFFDCVAKFFSEDFPFDKIMQKKNTIFCHDFWMTHQELDIGKIAPRQSILWWNQIPGCREWKDRSWSHLGSFVVVCRLSMLLPLCLLPGTGRNLTGFFLGKDGIFHE